MQHAIREKFSPPDYGPLAVSAPAPPAEGSIWPGQTPSGSFLFFDQKARGVGDLVTVIVDENISAEGSASTDLGRDSSVGADLTSDVGLTGLVSQSVRNFLKAIGVENPGTDVDEGSKLNVISSNSNNDFEGDGTTKRS
ncbi:MAG: flagellar basal body L-ring protein FlgH, partial [Myxococcota bacterium]